MVMLELLCVFLLASVSFRCRLLLSEMSEMRGKFSPDFPRFPPISLHTFIPSFQSLKICSKIRKFAEHVSGLSYNSNRQALHAQRRMSVNILAITAIFVIFVLSLFSSMAPPFLQREFGSAAVLESRPFKFMIGIAGGCILAVGFVHSFPDGMESLGVGVDAGKLPDYPWAGLFALLGAFLTFTAELFVHNGIRIKNRLANKESDDEPPTDTVDTWKDHDASSVESTSSSNDDSIPPSNPMDSAFPETTLGEEKADEEDELNKNITDSGKQKKVLHDDHGHDHFDYSGYKEKKVYFFTEMYVLLFGLTFHSFFVGFALGLTNHDLALFLAILVHQGFEGLALGSRVANANLSSGLHIFFIDLVFALSTPAGIIVGLIVAATVTDEVTYSIIDGAFNSFSAGILIFVALVHLLQEEMERPTVRNSIVTQGVIYVGVVIGAIIMCIIAIWA